jgi:hypothetical protein
MAKNYRRLLRGEITGEEYTVRNNGLYRLREGMIGGELDARLKELAEKAKAVAPNVVPLKRA